jgi:hypothetical protein
VKNILINGKPIDPGRVYRIVTNSYLAAGGDGYNIFARASDKYDTSMLQRDVLIEYIKHLGGRIRPEVKGRINIMKRNSMKQDSVILMRGMRSTGGMRSMRRSSAKRPRNPEPVKPEPVNLQKGLKTTQLAWRYHRHKDNGETLRAINYG